MNSEWQKILAADSPGTSDACLGHATGADHHTALCALTSEVVLHVTGEDAEKFLQAQFSNDISALEHPGSQLSTWSSPKGRVIALLRVVRISDGYLLRLPAELLEPVLKRLRMYVLMAKVSIEPRDDLLVMAFSGEQAATTLSGAGVDLPQNTNDTHELPAGGWITRVRDSAAAGLTHRYEIVADCAQVAQHWNTLKSVCVAAAESNWRLQNIDAGIPSINAATTEAFVLQMLNLQHIDGVSFKKGCFPGQEVVARMQYLGKLKRQMVCLQHVGDNVPKAGDEIFKAGRDSAVGKVVDAVSVDGNSCRMLAVVAIAELSEPLFLSKDEQHKLDLLDLPYETPAAS